MSFIAPLECVSVLKSVSETLSHSGWQAIVQEEMMAMEHNHTWELVPLSLNKKTIECKWVFTVKI